MTSSVAIVTGAAGEIGRAIARRLGEDHDFVLMPDLDGAAAEKAAASLGGAGRFIAFACDITDARVVNVKHKKARCGLREEVVELASDAEPENEVSARAHAALGFEDAGLIRCFRKDL